MKLVLWRRHQHDSLALRRHFAQQYDVHVGLYSYGCFDRWRMRGPMTVGRYCSIAATVRTVLDNHPFDAITTHPALYERKFGVVDADQAWTGRLIIEDDVWIGHNALLLPGCNFVGRGAIIGAGAIVTKPVPAYTIVAGNPARKLRDRFTPDVAAALEASGWWLLDPPALKAILMEDPQVIRHPTTLALAARFDSVSAAM